MGSEYFPGRTTPETWVGASGGKIWQMQRKASKNVQVSYGDGLTQVQVDRRYESDTDTEPLPDEDEYTENHYSESEFHAEQEEDEKDDQEKHEKQEEEVMQEGSQIKVSHHPPADFEADSHLLHIDFVTNQLERFGMASPGNRRSTPISPGIVPKKLPGHQHNISFSRQRVREIERTNHILLQRILSTRPTLQTMSGKLRPTKSSSSTHSSRVTSAALNRKKVQRKIASDNEILLKKVSSIGVSKSTTC